MVEAVIVSTARTPIGRAMRGAFNLTHGAEMGGHVVRHAVERAGVDPAEVEEVVLGCANPEGATGGNIARQAALRAGLPAGVAAMTVNRFCSSGLQSIAIAANRVVCDGVPVAVAGRITPVPGGVGPMTIACLLANTLTATARANGLPEPEGLTP